MSPQPPTKRIPHALLEWILWFAITTGVIVIYFVLGQRPPSPSTSATPPAFAFVGLLPLAVSTALRWALLPRITDPQKRLPFFIIGLAMAESCGLLGIFLGGPHKDTLFTLSLLGLAQFFPGLIPRPAPTPPAFR